MTGPSASSVPLSFAEEWRGTLALSIPLCTAYAGNKLLSLVDTIIVGHISATAISGASIGISLFFLAAMLGAGTLMGLDPLVSQAIGRGDRDAASRLFVSGFWLALLLFVPLTGVMFLSCWLLLPLLQIDAPIQNATYAYLLGRAPSVLFFFLFVVMRCYLQSLSLTRPILIATVVANILNVPISVFLAMGDQGLSWLGLPAVGFEGWGIFGAALGTTIVTFLQIAALYWAIRQLNEPKSERRFDPASTKTIAETGFPIGLQILAEGGLFSAVTLMMGTFGEDILGGHHVALQIASFTFTICLGLSNATCVRVGYAVGRGDPAGAKQAGWIGMGLSSLFMGCCAILMWLFATPLASLFSSEAGVREAAVSFLVIAALFQLFDGVQIVGSGAIRGTGNTRLPFLINLFTHWCLGMPIILTFAFATPLKAAGMWWGLTLSLTVGSLVMMWMFSRVTSNTGVAKQDTHKHSHP